MPNVVLQPIAAPSVGTNLDRLLPPTLLPLDRFARVVSYSPMLFHQVFVTQNELQPDSSCSDPVLQYTWQPRGGGRPGRQEISQAIQQAEDMIYRVLKFTPAPRWFEDEVIVTGDAHRYRSTFSNLGFGVRANNYRLIEPGVERYSYIDAPSVTYADIDGDSYRETASCTVDSVLDPNEVAVFYPGYGPDPAFEIRPVKVTVDSANQLTTIEFARHLCVRPELQERLDAAGVDGMSDGNFVVEVDVYKHYNDPSGIDPGVAGFEWACGGCGVCTACTTSTTSGCFRIIDGKNGMALVQPATWATDETGGGYYNYDGCLWVQPPARVTLRYRAGYVDKRLARPMVEMAPELERAVTFLALSYLDRDWLTCEQIRNLQAHWRFDLAKNESSPAQSSSFRIDPMLYRCPFGTTRAALYAWRVCQPLLIGEAVLNV